MGQPQLFSSSTSHRFADLILRLKTAAQEKFVTEKNRDESEEEGDGFNWQRYLSAHPMTDERVKAFQQN